MNRDQVTRRDFPTEEHGYDRASVDAHLQAVAASIAALEAQVKAVEVERDALRRTIEADPEVLSRLPTRIAAVPEPKPVEGMEPAAGQVKVPVTEAVDEVPSDPDESGARLVAMKMALDGSGRDAVRERLDTDYDLPDIEVVLDDVFRRVS